MWCATTWRDMPRRCRAARWSASTWTRRRPTWRRTSAWTACSSARSWRARAARSRRARTAGPSGVRAPPTSRTRPFARSPLSAYASLPRRGLRAPMPYNARGWWLQFTRTPFTAFVQVIWRECLKWTVATRAKEKRASRRFGQHTHTRTDVRRVVARSRGAGHSFVGLETAVRHAKWAPLEAGHTP